MPPCTCMSGPQPAPSSKRGFLFTWLLTIWILIALIAVPEIHAQNVITTIAGGANPLPTNDPSKVLLGNPANVVEDATGNIYVSSRYGPYVFKVNATNQISILAGTGYTGLTATVGGPATSTPLTNPGF